MSRFYVVVHTTLKDDAEPINRLVCDLATAKRLAGPEYVAAGEIAYVYETKAKWVYVFSPVGNVSESPATTSR